ncbi:metallophosphoesterase, partial [Streptomyces olivaceus]
MVVVFVLAALLVVGVLVTANWYVWRRLFRDTTRAPGPVRRIGAAVIAGGWVLTVGALVAERAGAPFWLQRVLAWPGFLWLALSLYLLLAVVAGEVVRPLLRRYLERRAAARQARATTGAETGVEAGVEPSASPAAADERIPAGTAPPQTSDAPDAPQSSGAPDTLDTPKAPDAPESPDTPSSRTTDTTE